MALEESSRCGAQRQGDYALGSELVCVDGLGEQGFVKQVGNWISRAAQLASDRSLHEGMMDGQVNSKQRREAENISAIGGLRQRYISDLD